MKPPTFAAVLLPFVLAACAEEEAPGGGGAGGASTSNGQAGEVATGGAGGSGGTATAGGAGGAAMGGGPMGGAPSNGGAGGSEACDPSACQSDIPGIMSLPSGATTYDFETCTGACACCDSNGAYTDPINNVCVECSIDATLDAAGISRVGGSGTYFVGCITGNANAPIQAAALFANGPSVELELEQPATFFGFTGLPSSSNSLPTVTLEGYNADGELTGLDSFTFVTPGGDCATSNPAAQFFAFRACCGPMVRAVVTFSDANTGIDSLTVF
jgi:hypothetical protein